MERAPDAHRLTKSDNYQPKPVGPTSDYRQHSEQPAAQHPEMTSPVREPAMNTPPQSVSSQLSASTSPAAMSTSLTKASTPPWVPAATASSESPTSAPGPPIVSPPGVESTPPQISTPPNVSPASCPAAPPRLSSPHLMMQGLRPPTSAVTEVSPAESKHLSVRSSSSSSLPASPPVTSTPLASTDSVSRPVGFSSVSSLSETVVHQTKSSLPPTASGPSSTVSPPANVSTSSYSVSAPISSLQQMVQGSTSPLTSCFPDTSGVRHDRPGPPKLISSTSSVGTKSLFAGVPPPLLSKMCSKTSDPVPTPQRQTYTPPAADSDIPSLAPHESPTVRTLSTLPLLTTQASRTAPVSAPPALVSVPPALGMSSGVVCSSDSEQHPPNTTPPHALKQLSPKPEHYGHSGDRKALATKRNGKPEEHPSQLDSCMKRTSQKVEANETNKSEIRSPRSLTDLPGKSLQTAVAPDQKPKNKQTDSERHHMQSSVICEAEDSTVEHTPLRKSSHLHSARVEHLTDEESFDDTSHTASLFDGNSMFDTPSRIDVSSILGKTPLLDGNSSCGDDSPHFDDSFHLREDTSRFDSTSQEEEQQCAAFETTLDSSSSVEDSRDDKLDSTREGETSEAEETKDSFQITGKSSLNNTSQIEESSVDSSDVSNSRFFVPSQPACQGIFLKFIIMETRITWVDKQWLFV